MHALTFSNNFRNSTTGAPVGLHLSPMNWLSQMGLHDGEFPIDGDVNNQSALIQKHGVGAFQENHNPQITVHSNSGDPEYDQAATYLAKHAIQLGRPLFPYPADQPIINSQPWPKELVVPAANHLRQQEVQVKQTKTAEQMQFPEMPTEPSWQQTQQNWATETCPNCRNDVPHGAKQCHHCGEDLRFWNEEDPDAGGLGRFEDYYSKASWVVSSDMQTTSKWHLAMDPAAQGYGDPWGEQQPASTVDTFDQNNMQQPQNPQDLQQQVEVLRRRIPTEANPEIKAQLTQQLQQLEQELQAQTSQDPVNQFDNGMYGDFDAGAYQGPLGGVLGKWHLAIGEQQLDGGVGFGAQPPDSGGQGAGDSFDVSQASPEQQAGFQKAVNYAIELINKGIDDQVVAQQLSDSFPQFNAWYLLNQAKQQPAPAPEPEAQPQTPMTDQPMATDTQAPPMGMQSAYTLVDRYEDVWGTKIARVADADGNIHDIAQEQVDDVTAEKADPYTALLSFIDSMPKVENSVPSVKARVQNLKIANRMAREALDEVGYSEDGHKIDTIYRQCQASLLDMSDYLKQLDPYEGTYNMKDSSFKYDAYDIERELVTYSVDTSEQEKIVKEQPAVLVSRLAHRDEGSVRNAAEVYISEHVWQLPPAQRDDLTKRFVEAAVATARVFETNDQPEVKEEEEDWEGPAASLFL